MTEVTVSGLTFSIGHRLAVNGFSGRHEPVPVYIIGDGEYGSIVIGEDGMVKSSDVHNLPGDRKEFIKAHMDALFYPANKKALDDLNEFGFMFSEIAGFFVYPVRE